MPSPQDVVNELNSIGEYMKAQMEMRLDGFCPDQFGAAMTSSVCCQIRTLKNKLEPVKATAMIKAVHASSFSDAQKKEICLTIQEKVQVAAINLQSTDGPQACLKVATKQTFIKSGAAQNYWTAIDWTFFGAPEKTFRDKLQHAVDRMQLGGFVNPDEHARADIVTCVASAHFQTGASWNSRTLYDNIWVLKDLFDTTPIKAPQLEFTKTFPLDPRDLPKELNTSI